MTERIAVQVPTKTLRKLLDENPEVVAELQSLACEKIAEELYRKARNTSQVSIERSAKDAIARAFSEYNRTYRLPPKVAEMVRDEVGREIETRLESERRSARFTFDSTIREKTQDAVKVLQDAVDGMYAKHRDQMQAEIRKIAREEFLSVISEVKGLTND